MIFRCMAILVALAGPACGRAGAGPNQEPPDATEAEAIEPGQPDARDLVPYARLWARLTNPTRGFWPHEAWDAVFTVRDSSPITAYKPVPGEENVIRVDLQPWLGRTVPLRSLSWSWEGAVPSGVKVFLAEGCGLPPSQILDWSDPLLALDLGDLPAGCVEVHFFIAAESSLTALSLWTADPSIPWPDNAGPKAVGPPAHPSFGAIEGFYGLPWSWREREHMVQAMAGFGLGPYLYAPKDDPFHRARWREPYPDAEMDAFESWNAKARSLGVTIYFGISPFIDFKNDEEDYRTLLQKLLSFAARGFTGFALLADDIEFEAKIEVDGALGASHASLTNRLLADLRAVVPEARMWFVPTVYSDERLARWPGAKAYLAALRALDPAVVVMWTGPRTSCTTMTAADMQAFRTLVGRKPLIWDNFWANDGGDLFMGRILLAPFSGRSADLLEAVHGIAHNLSLQGALSRLTLGTFAAWLEDPDLSPEGLVQHAIAAEQSFAIGAGRDPGRDAKTLAFLMASFDASAPDSNFHFKALEQAVEALQGALHEAGVPVAQAGKLLSLLARMAALPSDLYHSGLDPDLVDDAWFPAEKVRGEAMLGLWTLKLLGERLAGRTGAEAEAQALEAQEASSRSRFLFSPGLLDGLFAEVSGLPAEDRGFLPPVRADTEPVACKVGMPVSWQGWSKATHVEVAGLPGAEVDSQGLVVFRPPHPGTFEAVAVALSDTGWDFQIVKLPCE